MDVLAVEKHIRSQSGGLPPGQSTALQAPPPNGNPPRIRGRLARAANGQTVGYGTGQPPPGAGSKTNVADA